MALAVFVLDFGGVGEAGFRRIKADLFHGFAEKRAIFRLVDGFRIGADHLDIVALKNAHAAERQCGVQRGLAAHGRQQRVRAFLGDDLGDHFRRDRFDIGCIRQIGIGHDRGRIGVDEDDTVAFLFQRLTGLRARIVEFTSLADDNGARADNQDRFDICTFRHGRSSYLLRAHDLVRKPVPIFGIMLLFYACLCLETASHFRETCCLACQKSPHGFPAGWQRMNSVG